MNTTSIADILLLALENLKDGVIITQTKIDDNFIIYVNKGFCKMTGYDKTDVIGKNCSFLLGSETNQEPVRQLKNALDNKKDTVQEMINFKKDETIFWNRLSITHIFDESNNVSHIIGIVEDITAKKEKEAFQRKLNNQKLIFKTTLFAQEKQKREIGEELHDNVNQILATLRLYMSVALSQKDRQIEMLEQGDEILALAIDEIRKLSKNLVGPSIKKETFKQAVSELINSMQIAVSFSIELIYDEAIVENISESSMLTFYRIIQEQLNNILKYAKPTSIIIKFSIDNAMIYLSIKDDGIGFDKVVLAQGIGLKNMKHRAEMEEGSFSVITSIGNGCEIRVGLPMVKYFKKEKVFKPIETHNNVY